MSTHTVLPHDTPVMTAEGLSHELVIYPDRLVIRSTDVLSRLFGHDETILLDDIKSVHAYKPSSVGGNWSQLIIIFKSGKSRGLSYSAKKHNIAEQLKETVEQCMHHSNVEPAMKSI